MNDTTPGTNHNYIGKCIKTIRLIRGWSQEDMAGRLNISIPAFSKIETGVTDINLSRLEQIASVYEVSIAQLLMANSKLDDHVAFKLPVFEKKLIASDIEIVALQRKVIELYEVLRQSK